MNTDDTERDDAAAAQGEGDAGTKGSGSAGMTSDEEGGDAGTKGTGSAGLAGNDAGTKGTGSAG